VQTRDREIAISGRQRAVQTIALALLWLVPASILWRALASDWRHVWSAVGIYSIPPPFLDLRVITSGVETLRHGGDPLVANSFDPLGRSLNYPRIWLTLFSFLGINDRNVVFAGLSLCVLFLACVSTMIVRSRREGETLALLLSGLSLSSMFALERGNIDLVIFSLIFVGCAASSERFRSCLFALAAVLKIYPLAALLQLLFRRPFKQRLFALVLSASVLVVLALQFRDIERIGRSTPVAGFLSFGVLSIRAQSAEYAGRFALFSSHASTIGHLAVFVSFATALLVVLLAWFGPNRVSAIVPECAANSRLFCAFGAIYAFCFAIGSNWDYRFIFLIPTLPLAFQVFRRRELRDWGAIYIALVIASQFSLAFKIRFGLALSHLCSFGVFLFVLDFLTLQAKRQLALPRPADSSLFPTSSPARNLR